MTDFTCECGKSYSTKSNLNKHKKSCSSIKKEQENSNLMNQLNLGMEQSIKQPSQSLQELDTSSMSENELHELMKLQEELLNLFLNNPSSVDLTKSVNTNYMEQIKSMNKEELQTRIMEIKHNLSSKLDRRYSDSLVSFGSLMLGSLMGIGKELEKKQMEDELLCKSSQELLSYRLGLFQLPPEVKVAGISVLNIVDCMKDKYKAQLSKPKQVKQIEKEVKQLQEKGKLEEVEEKVEEPQQNPLEVEMKKSLIDMVMGSFRSDKPVEEITKEDPVENRISGIEGNDKEVKLKPNQYYDDFGNLCEEY